jgi:hypothetical protein
LPEPGVKGVTAVASTGDGVLLAYQTRTGETRVRVAALGALASAKAPPLFAADRFGGIATKNPFVVVTGAGAYILPSSSDSRVAFVAADGAVAAVKSGR